MEAKPELVQRMIAHLRKCAAENVARPNDLHREMLAIVAELPPEPEPVDPLREPMKALILSRLLLPKPEVDELVDAICALTRGMEIAEGRLGVEHE